MSRRFLVEGASSVKLGKPTPKMANSKARKRVWIRVNQQVWPVITREDFYQLRSNNGNLELGCQGTWL